MDGTHEQAEKRYMEFLNNQVGDHLKSKRGGKRVGAGRPKAAV